MNYTSVAEVAEEMNRQIAKWGEQNHPDYFLPDVFEVSVEHDIELTTEFAKALCDERLGATECSWQDILNEELMEARDEAIAGNIVTLREELIQIAAVACSWVNAIDRRNKA
jgi:hypothetical protein